MRDQQTTGLLQTWVPVADEQGRIRLEAQWAVPTQAPTHVAHAA